LVTQSVTQPNANINNTDPDFLITHHKILVTWSISNFPHGINRVPINLEGSE